MRSSRREKEEGKSRFSIIDVSMKLLSLVWLAALIASAEPKHLANLQQLTHGGQNAEAYWSPDGRRLIFQSTRPGFECDQIFIMNPAGSVQKLVQTATGRT